MVYARDMAKRVEAFNEQAEKAKQERIARDATFTREFCHSTLSREIEQLASKGQRHIILYVTEDIYYKRLELLEKKNSYWVHTWDYIDLNTLREVVTEHEYKMEESFTSVPKSSTKDWECRKIEIRW